MPHLCCRRDLFLGAHRLGLVGDLTAASVWVPDGSMADSVAKEPSLVTRRAVVLVVLSSTRFSTTCF